MKLFSNTIFLAFCVLIISNNNGTGQNIVSEEFYNLNTSISGYGVKKMKNPAIFQGNRKKQNYFEGWYFKMVSADGKSIISIIPGISLSKKGGEKHAFIQVIDGVSTKTYYKNFPIDAFKFSNQRFAVRIGDNHFCQDSIVLNIQDDSLKLTGKIIMTNQVDLTPDKQKNKRIMGIFHFVPFMQCYHGVVSLTHDLEGDLSLNGQNLHFNHGNGYIEKDWGRSMPSAWIWMQSNSFQSENTSFMLSIANIPWMGAHFTGFLGFFLHKNEVHRFGTYTRSKLKLESSESNALKITLKNKNHTYYIEAEQQGYGSLIAPVKGSMDRHISEGVDAKISLKIIDRKDQIIFHDSTTIAGLEIVGNIQILKSKRQRKN